MIVQVTVTEITAYQTAVKLWSIKRAEFLCKNVFADKMTGISLPRDVSTELLREWEMANPFPTFLPQI